MCDVITALHCNRQTALGAHRELLFAQAAIDELHDGGILSGSDQSLLVVDLLVHCARVSAGTRIR